MAAAYPDEFETSRTTILGTPLATNVVRDFQTLIDRDAAKKKARTAGTRVSLQGGKAAMSHTVAGTIVNNGPKVGRNKPCPCGSGEKFKKCHGKPPPPHVPPRQLQPAPSADCEDEAGRLRPYYDVFRQLLPVFPPEPVYVYLETGLIITAASRPTCDPVDLAAYDAALQRWNEMSEEEHDRHRALWQDYCRDSRLFPHWAGAGPDDGHDATLPACGL